MPIEYRIIFTAIFADKVERDQMYTKLKNQVANLASGNAPKRADMTKDDYLIPDERSTEKVF